MKKKIGYFFLAILILIFVAMIYIILSTILNKELRELAGKQIIPAAFIVALFSILGILFAIYLIKNKF